MKTTYPTQKQTSSQALANKVWEVLASQNNIKKYMFGTKVVSTWQKNDTLIKWGGSHRRSK